jgi:hypothetical protein
MGKEKEMREIGEFVKKRKGRFHFQYSKPRDQLRKRENFSSSSGIVISENIMPSTCIRLDKCVDNRLRESNERCPNVFILISREAK